MPRGFFGDEYETEEERSQKLLDSEEIFMNKSKSAWWASSENPETLALTIKGALLLYVPFILALANNFHLPLSGSFLATIITDISFIIAALMVLWGFARKVKNWVKKIKQMW